MELADVAPIAIDDATYQISNFSFFGLLFSDKRIFFLFSILYNIFRAKNLENYKSLSLCGTSLHL